MGDIVPFWRDLAACNGENPEIFFNGHLVSQALKVCATCPVIQQCRGLVDRIEYGIADQYKWGIWAGETVKERINRRANEIETAYPRAV
jgi:WhiB family redox-sensing transcriptional regulator